MKYRRYGRTEIEMPVITCGGMRFQQSWSDMPMEEIKRGGQANLEAAIRFSLEVGANHIETARGYGTSEMQLGQVLPRLNREELILQTKVCPEEDAKVFLENFEKSMAYLKTDYVDLFSIHGINNQELLDWTLRDGGCMEVALKLKEQGRVRHIGYSTHASEKVICAANASNAFDYCNVHWYFVNELNWEAIEVAAGNDMGVFIISPNDKGGKLYEPSEKLVELCGDLHPMQWNALFCLSRPEVHTLSMGVSCPQDFDTHLEMLDHYDNAYEVMAPIERKLRAELEKTHGSDWCAGWWKGLPEWDELPKGVNVKEILRLWTYAKALDLVPWGKMRYNLLGNAGHWFPGEKVSDYDRGEMKEKLNGSPFADRIPDILEEAHEMFNDVEVKRLSQSD
ncbi:aldo/keto reductase [Pelagicoccus sp. SDUM812003]|uniref:aldo/keto reductase n=1 Tax=Pelagicoccus sp. SDUM812003 TaxID=3041267 RepID=UPI00280CBFF7|nr:aldo/keto reductase [Pelagicoccus sp. SDUM812003]MDQ8201938.1 aldo/keto reductase [Pelagicoccus sp. SDUM812003]